MKLDMSKGDLLGAPKAKDSEPATDEWTDAGQDILDAIADKDATAIGLVLKRMCGGDDYEDETDEE